MKPSIACSWGTRLNIRTLSFRRLSLVSQTRHGLSIPVAFADLNHSLGNSRAVGKARRMGLMSRHLKGSGDADQRRVSLRRGSIYDRRRPAARGAPVLVPGLPVSRRRERDGQRHLRQGRGRRLRAADRLREPGRQRLDHAPPLLRPVRHAGLQRGRAAPAADHRAGGDPGRS